MVGDSKILTVSYGTFSCTLEGFDEPFSTMKAIAEYFRDLAADDRYFGAEPPTPDTEMLHQIAERTIQRRVAAELAENGVILRQTEASQQPAPEARALAVEMPKAERREEQSPAPKADVMSSVSDVPTAPQRSPVRAAVASTIAAPEHGGGDTVAEKLQRIRAVVARENAAPAPYSEDQHAEEFGATGFEDLEEDAPSALFDTPLDTGFDAGFEEEDEDALNAVMAGLTDADAADGVAEEDTDVADDPVVEDVTEDISDDTDVEAQEAEAEVAEAEATDEVEAEAVEEVKAEVTEDVAEDDVETVEAEAAQDAEPEAEDDVAEVEAEVEASDDAAVEDDDTEANALREAVAEDDTTDAAPEEIEPLRTKPRRRIVVQKISRADMEAARAAKEAELPPELEAELMAELAEVEAEVAPVEEAAVEDSVAEDVADDVEAAVEDEPQDDDADDILSRLTDSLDDPVADHEEVAPTSIMDEDDDSDDVLKSLMEDADSAEVDAEVEAEAETEVEAEAETEVEAADVEADVEDNADEAAETHAEEDAPKRKSFAAMAEDDAIERLMSTTSSRLENDESSVRRASIAHLKAAVAATKADSSIAEAADKRDEEELDQYRDDLARVVRPSRPVASGGRSDRPSPLVLVSEQRIDHPAVAPDAVAASAADIDVRPRRVTRGNLALQEEMEEEFDDENLFTEDAQITFAEYAAKAGALELPDLLEAAAAHYIEIEGAEHFTRPMLMRKLAQVSGPEAPSREDGLRAFGTLLRTGKIVKTDNGKFTLSKSSQFA
ncbi:hypothetical protein SAMN05444273_101374 [Litoreibacter ascidiaceicola]|uniref:Lipoprotein n=1 Tax=Litoreibacter ascidiaceicola TaxID=1486859 RepID=A0A1M4TCP3_9RHOB|nr:hypothetical protein [Litoreibacter ascidiaceicola]SHE42128.1 hypothetical protein SAMN05444273_101374 [Litoreibacter ascidiaceicola]